MILTIGDSFTYGEELTDRARQAWPYLLGAPVLNLGKPASSNDRIFRIAIEETTKIKFDIVIVGWSFPNRLEVFDNNNPLCINVNNKRQLPWVDDYYKYSYNEDFAFRKWFSQVLALQNYFKQIDQRYIFCNVAGLKWHYKQYQSELEFLFKNIDTTYYAGWPVDGMLEWQGDCSKGPGGHPLELGHQRIAEQINEHIRHLGWLS